MYFTSESFDHCKMLLEQDACDRCLHSSYRFVLVKLVALHLGFMVDCLALMAGLSLVMDTKELFTCGTMCYLRYRMISKCLEFVLYFLFNVTGIVSAKIQVHLHSVITHLKTVVTVCVF